MLEPFEKRELDLSKAPMAPILTDEQLEQTVDCLLQLSVAEVCRMGIAMCEESPDDGQLAKLFLAVIVCMTKRSERNV